MSTCQLCGAQNLTWLENIRKLVNPITGQEHGPGLCVIKIPRYKMIDGVALMRPDLNIARDITKAAIDLHINPFRVRVVRDGDFLVIKR